MLSGTPPICKKCGYDLTGLPDRGGCPECGNTFDIHKKIGLARELSPQEREQRVTLWIKIWGLVGLAVMAMICSGLLSLLAAHPRKPLSAGGLFSAMLLVVALGIYLLDRMDRKQDD